MALTERLALLVTMDAKGAIKGFNDLGKAADRNLGKSDQRLDVLASRFQKAGAGMLAGAGLAAAGLYKAGQAAAGLEQSVGGTAAVFGNTSTKIDEFAKKAASAIGLSERQFREATTSIGGQLKGLGFNVDQAADQSVRLTKVAADLAATYGGTTAEAVAALGAAFRGEADPAERFNLFLNQTRVNAKAVELGLASTTSQVSANAKAQATLALITEQSADALGQFAREADTAAGSQARMKAELENAVAALGQGVAPIIGDLAAGVGGLASKFNELPTPIQNSISKVATYGTIATGALGATSLLVGKVLDARDRFSDLAVELPRTSRALNGIGRAAATLGPLLVLDQLEPLGFLNEAIPDLEQFENLLVKLAQNKSIDDLGIDVDALGKAVERVGDPSTLTRLDNALTSITNLGGLADFGKDSELDQAKDLIDSFDKSLASIATRDPATATEAFRAVAERLGMTTSDLLPLLDDYEGTLTGVETEQLIAADGMGELGTAAGTAADRIAALRTKFDELTSTLRASVDADFAYEDAVDSTESALQRLAEANGLVVDSETSRAEKLEAVDDATRDARDALLEQADAAVAAADENFKLAGVTLTTAQKQQIFRDKLAELAGDLAAGSPLRIAIDGTIARYDELAKDRKSTFTLEIVERGQVLKSERFSGIDGARAIGGPVSAGSTYLVNEYGPRGPEVFTPSVNGTVSPAGMAAGPTSVVNNVTVINPSPEPVSTTIRSVRFNNALVGG